MIGYSPVKDDGDYTMVLQTPRGDTLTKKCRKRIFEAAFNIDEEDDDLVNLPRQCKISSSGLNVTSIDLQ